MATEVQPRRVDHVISRRNLGLATAAIAGGAVASGKFLPPVMEWALRAFRSQRPETSPKTIPNVEVTILPTTYDNDLQFPPTEALGATDGFASIVLPDKSQLILCSDTYKGALTDEIQGKIGFADSFYMVNNVAVIIKKNEDGTTSRTVLSGPKDNHKLDTSWISPDPQKDDEEQQIRKDRGTNSFYWLGPAVVDEQNKKMFVPLTRNVAHVPSDGWWSAIGTDMARIDISGPIPKLEKITKISRDEPEGMKEAIWGAALVTDTKKDYTYIYGSIAHKNENPVLTKKDVHVARVPVGQIDNRQSWEFWNGKDWIGVDKTKAMQGTKGENDAFNEAKAQSQSIIDTEKGISSGFSVNFIKGKYVLTNIEERPYFSGKKIQGFAADTPQGPWTEHTLVEEIPDFNTGPHKPFSGTAISYLAYLHPEAQSNQHPGKTLVTLCRNVIGGKDDKPLASVATDVSTYRPVSFWVDLDKIVNNVM